MTRDDDQQDRSTLWSSAGAAGCDRLLLPLPTPLKWCQVGRPRDVKFCTVSVSRNERPMSSPTLPILGDHMILRRRLIHACNDPIATRVGTGTLLFSDAIHRIEPINALTVSLQCPKLLLGDLFKTQLAAVQQLPARS